MDNISSIVNNDFSFLSPDLDAEASFTSVRICRKFSTVVKVFDGQDEQSRDDADGGDDEQAT